MESSSISSPLEAPEKICSNPVVKKAGYLSIIKTQFISVLCSYHILLIPTTTLKYILRVPASSFRKTGKIGDQFSLRFISRSPGVFFAIKLNQIMLKKKINLTCLIKTLLYPFVCVYFISRYTSCSE